jgi:hypothetical protein
MHSRGRSEGTIFAPLRADAGEVIPMRTLSPSISRVGLKLCTLAALLLVWDAPASALPVTYQEIGRLFTSFVTPYDGTMHMDGTVTLPTPLPDNLKLQDFAAGFGTGGGSYAFSDGVMDYTPSDSTLGDLQFATDQSGKVVAWQVEIFSNAGPMILSQNLPSVSGSGFDKVLSGSAQQLALSDGPATWTEVPEPAASALALTGLSVLALGMRRKRT